MENSQDWQRLADYVVAGRLGLGMRSRREFATYAAISERILNDIETARRSSYDRATLVALELALAWEYGSTRRILEGGEPKPTILADDERERLLEAMRKAARAETERRASRRAESG